MSRKCGRIYCKKYGKIIWIHLDHWQLELFPNFFRSRCCKKSCVRTVWPWAPWSQPWITQASFSTSELWVWTKMARSLKFLCLRFVAVSPVVVACFVARSLGIGTAATAWIQAERPSEGNSCSFCEPSEFPHQAGDIFCWFLKLFFLIQLHDDLPTTGRWNFQKLVKLLGLKDLRELSIISSDNVLNHLEVTFLFNLGTFVF